MMKPIQSPLIAILFIVFAALLLTSHATGAMTDEIALRHYAARGERARVDAEIARLSALDPHWRAPDDLWTETRSHADEDDLWDVLQLKGPEAARTIVNARLAKEDGWSPSENLTRAIESQAVRQAIGQAARTSQWKDIAALVDARPYSIEQRDVETRWWIAQALVQIGRKNEAQAQLRSLLLDPRASDDEKRATIQRAIALLGMTPTEELIATLPDRQVVLAPIAVDLTRARISAQLRDEKTLVPDQAALTLLEEGARSATTPDDAGLIAWYAFKQRNNRVALEWFRLALAKGANAMNAHGLALTLLRLGQPREAEEVAYTWRDRLSNNAILFIDILEADLTLPNPPAIDAERLLRYARVTIETASGEGAQALAWYAVNTCQHQAALAWFERATAWFPKEATVMGYALTLRRLDRRREFIEVVNRYDGLFPSVVALVWGDFENKQPSPCDQQALTSATTGSRSLRRARPTELPLPTFTENPLRFPAALPLTAHAVEAYRPWRQVAGPLTARRVLGVASMPYERDGFILLPAYDGSTAPATVPHSRRSAPLGTLWAEEQNKLVDQPQASSHDAARFRLVGTKIGER